MPPNNLSQISSDLDHARASGISGQQQLKQKHGNTPRNTVSGESTNENPRQQLFSNNNAERSSEYSPEKATGKENGGYIPVQGQAMLANANNSFPEQNNAMLAAGSSSFPDPQPGNYGLNGGMGGYGLGSMYGGGMYSGGMGGMYGGGMYGGLGSPYGYGAGMGMGPLSNLNQFLFSVQSVIFSLGQAVQIIGMNAQGLKQLVESVSSMLDHAIHSWNELQRLDAESRGAESEEEKKRRRRLRAFRMALVAGISYLGYRIVRRLFFHRRNQHALPYHNAAGFRDQAVRPSPPLNYGGGGGYYHDA